jgi:2-oxoglutarate ferredoxin oxidoreductase subunit gamma
MGKTLAITAVDHIAHVTFFPSYGAEVRGGTSNCQVVFSSEEIASPVSDLFDSMLIMNQASADKFLSRRADPCLVVINGALCETRPEPAAVVVEALGIANELGDSRVANFVMLGAYLECKPLFPVEAVRAAIEKVLASKGSKLVDMNLRAFDAGIEACRKSRSK